MMTQVKKPVVMKNWQKCQVFQDQMIPGMARDTPGGFQMKRTSCQFRAVEDDRLQKIAGQDLTIEVDHVPVEDRELVEQDLESCRIEDRVLLRSITVELQTSKTIEAIMINMTDITKTKRKSSNRTIGVVDQGHAVENTVVMATEGHPIISTSVRRIERTQITAEGLIAIEDIMIGTEGSDIILPIDVLVEITKV